MFLAVGPLIVAYVTSVVFFCWLTISLGRKMLRLDPTIEKQLRWVHTLTLSAGFFAGFGFRKKMIQENELRTTAVCVRYSSLIMLCLHLNIFYNFFP